VEEARSGGAASPILSAGRRVLLQIFAPVEGDAKLLGVAVGGGALNHDEPLPVGRDVVGGVPRRSSVGVSAAVLRCWRGG
jgi:hypothetical protein